MSIHLLQQAVKNICIYADHQHRLESLFGLLRVPISKGGCQKPFLSVKGLPPLYGIKFNTKKVNGFTFPPSLCYDGK